jgi:hypothetical protein
VTGLPLLDWNSGAAEPATGSRPSPVASYPDMPGAKTGGTSRDSADAIASEARRLRELVLAALELHGPMTADQIASLIGWSILSVRPRCSELRRLGRVVGTRQRRKNASGHSAEVLALAGSEIR